INDANVQHSGDVATFPRCVHNRVRHGTPLFPYNSRSQEPFRMNAPLQKLSDSDSGQRPNEEELRALVERIIDSGALGRSRTYANILRYLAECSISGTSPKEMSIALDVLGRDADFDISRDSVVRVNVHHLRNKLSKYFERHGERE